MTIHTAGLTHRFGSTHVLNGVDLDLGPGIHGLLGRNGVGKSTLVNRLVPDAQRETGDVSGVGKGRHTSTQSVALELPGGGWIIQATDPQGAMFALVGERKAA